jgi:glucosyl-3-phosphoglycerate synthase
MSDFQQTGPLTTLHLLGRTDLSSLDQSLAAAADRFPICLVLPSLISEIKGPALGPILSALASVSYLSKIVVTLGPATESEFREAREFFGRLPHETVLIWNNGPRLESLYQRLEQTGLSAGPDGKGRSVWMALGYLLADSPSAIIALHDCDIVTYDRRLLDRLVYPVASPLMKYHFCKGFYARFSQSLHGRVTRLYVAPLLQALTQILGDLPFLNYLEAFRYPLAGEFCMTGELARSLHFPSGWGLEIGVLAEVYRHTSLQKICQSELCERYDHKHQTLSNSPKQGLGRMATDIAWTLFHLLAEEGVCLTPALLATLPSVYLRHARTAVRRYHHEALINQLTYDLHLELSSAERFSKILAEAGHSFQEKVAARPAIIPDWDHVRAALPTFLGDLKTAVDADNAS